MRISSECHSCLRKLAAQAADMATEDNRLREEARNKADSILNEQFKPGAISIAIATNLHNVIKHTTKNHDPYRRMKDKEIDVARTLFSAIKNSYVESFPEYLKLSALGNALDFFKPIDEVEKEMAGRKIEFAIDDSGQLEGKVKSARWILYLADNAGEVFFDLPLLRLMRQYARVTYVVKEAPVQNDITLEDVRKAGLEKVVGDTMTTGTATPGIDFALASARFKEAFEAADFIFAKGMGYYETLEELQPRGRIFYCLKAKCQPVADSLKVPLNSYVAMLR